MPSSITSSATMLGCRALAGIGLAALLFSGSALGQEEGRRPIPAEYQSSAADDDPRAKRQLPQRKGEITFDNLKFDIEKDGKFDREMLTKEIEELNNQVVQIRGFILPASVMQMRNIKKFVLVRDNQECCFGPGAALYDCIIVQMKGDATAEFTTRPVAVKGKFKIKEFKYPGDEGHYAIYELEGTSVE